MPDGIRCSTVFTVDDRGMTGIVAAPVTHDRSRLIGQQIDDLPLPSSPHCAQ